MKQQSHSTISTIGAEMETLNSVSASNSISKCLSIGVTKLMLLHNMSLVSTSVCSDPEWTTMSYAEDVTLRKRKHGQRVTRVPTSMMLQPSRHSVSTAGDTPAGSSVKQMCLYELIYITMPHSKQGRSASTYLSYW